MSEPIDDVVALRRLVELDDDVGSDELDKLEDEAELEMLEEMQREGEVVLENDAHESETVPDESNDALLLVPAESDDEEEKEVSDYEFGPLASDEIARVVSDLRQHGLVECLRRHIVPNPAFILPLLLSLGIRLPRSVIKEAETQPYMLLPILKMVLTRILRQRQKLPQYNTVDDVLNLLQRSKRIIVLCGAGISVSCGIPDFRSKDGIYSILEKESQYELDDPSDMFDKDCFLRDPSMFYSFACVTTFHLLLTQTLYLPG